MTKQEIALRLTLKMLDMELFSDVDAEQIEDEYLNLKSSENVASIFNALMDNLKVD